jgi:hypothetical protein
MILMFGKSVVIFFHLQFKTIRVEVKAKSGYVFENDKIAVGFSAEEVEKEIAKIEENNTNTTNSQ